MPVAVEEVLRWVSPVNHFGRTATEDVELGGRQVRAGDKRMFVAMADRSAQMAADLDTATLLSN